MDKQQIAAAKMQFQQLLDRANKRFGKLQRASQERDWHQQQAAFHKAFDAFSRLWQFQLMNRPALLESGMQRSELGVIASKIGQLYYNFYLRSGDTGALLESYVFYDAIHTRQYFASAADAPDPAAAARQLRFYARFVVVCMLLNRKEEAMQLLQELQASVSAYVLQFSAPDAQEWQLVVNEVTALMGAADVAMPVPRSPGSLEVPFRPESRCRPWGPAATCAPHRQRLREALLVSYRPRQIKVAELPVELYRLAQALEWHDPRLQQQAAWSEGADAAAPGGQDGSGPAQGSSPPADAPARGASGPATTSGRVGPSSSASGGSPPPPPPAHLRTPPRLLLHKPTVQTLLCALLASSAAASPDDLLLLYLCADAAPMPAHVPSLEAALGDQPPAMPPRRMLLCPASALPAQQQRAPAAPAGAAAGASAGSGTAAGGGSGGAAAAAGGRPAGGAQAAGGPGSLTHGSLDGQLSPEELLVAASRRRVLLVADSNMAHDFARLQQASAPGLLCLMSPCSLPPDLGDPARQGSITSVALTCPVQALCVMTGVLDPEPGVLQQLQEVVDQVLLQLGRDMVQQLQHAAAGAGATSDGSAPAAGAGEGGGAAGEGGGASAGQLHACAAWSGAFSDALVRSLVLRFAFFRCCLSLHTSCQHKPPAALPSCFPPLPPAADATNPTLRDGVRRAAAVLAKGALFGGAPRGEGCGSSGVSVPAAVAAELPDIGGLSLGGGV